MRTRPTQFFLVLFACVNAMVRADVEEAPDAYELVVAAAVPVLPAPLRTLFQARIELMRRTAVTGGTDRAGSKADGTESERHRVMLDIAADAETPSARRAAARTFPHDLDSAKGIFQRHGVIGGTLPWTLHARYGALLEAFRRGNVEAIVREAGAVAHFATDACLPFNTTVARDGVDARGHTPAGKRAASNELHRTARGRLHLGLLRWARTRLDYEVRVSPERFSELSDPVEAIFAVLLDAHASIPSLLTIDVEAMSGVSVSGATRLVSNQDAYYRRVVERALPIMEQRLESAALLMANLIGTAWSQAGRPPPERWNGAAAPGKGRLTPGLGTEQRRVGSRSSTIFHRPTCQHARRIKQANLIRFPSRQAAGDAGRVPCKTCKPDEP